LFSIFWFIFCIISFQETLKDLLPLDDPDLRERVRERSKIVLGNRDRAEVGAAIGLSPDRFVNATDLSLELGLANSRVRAQLVALCKGGYLRDHPSVGASEKKMYERVEASLWAACRELIERAAKE
jgi:hypothetical protein